jgi:hypothetical protein
VLLQAARQTRFGLRLQFVGRRQPGFGHEFRQDRIALLGPEGAALGDLDRVLDRFGQIGELRRHLGRRFETMLARQPPAILLRDEGAVGDAEQRVMRLVHVGAAEMHIVGGDQRQVFGIGEIDQLSSAARSSGRPWRCKLDIEPVAEHRLAAGRAVRRGGVRLAFDDQAVERPPGPPVSAINPSACAASAAALTCGQSPGSAPR